MEGISNALFSGKFAAEAIVEGKLTEGKVESIYNKKLKSAMLPQLKRNSFLAKIFYHNPFIRKIMFKIAGNYLAEWIADTYSGGKK